MARTEGRPVINTDEVDPDFANSRRLYHGAVPFVMGKSVLDFGCGYGHGSYFVLPYAQKVVGLEIEPKVAAKAKALFGSERLSFVSDLGAVGAIDIVLSIEAIEHLTKDELPGQLEKFSKMATSIYCTTPNGNVFHHQPTNEAEKARYPYHEWHYTEIQLIELFRRYYSFVDVHGVLRDPLADRPKGRFMGYAIYASNGISTPVGFMENHLIRLEY